MNESAFQVRLNLPRKALAEERAAATVGYALGAETPLPSVPDAVEAHFIEPVTVVATVTATLLAQRINHYLVRDGHGVMIDASRKPPVVSRLENVPVGLVMLIKADRSTETVAAGKTDDTELAGLIAGVLVAGG